MSKSTKIISFSVEPEIADMFTVEAKRRGWSKSDLLRYMVDKFPIDNQDIKLLVLKIPKELLEDEESLTQWFNSKKNALIHRIFS